MEMTLMAHQTSGALLVYTNGAPPSDAPLVLKLLMAHPAHGAPLVPIFFFELVRLSKHTNGASTGGAPLLEVTSNGAPARRCATNVIFLLLLLFLFCKSSNGAPPGGAPLVTWITNGAFVAGAPLVSGQQQDILDSLSSHTHFLPTSFSPPPPPCLGCLLFFTSFPP